MRHVDDGLEWNVRPPVSGGRASLRLKVSPTRVAEIRYASGRAELRVNGTVRYTTDAVVRLVTDLDGNPRSVAGISTKRVDVTVRHASGRQFKVSLQPNATKAVEHV